MAGVLRPWTAARRFALLVVLGVAAACTASAAERPPAPLAGDPAGPAASDGCPDPVPGVGAPLLRPGSGGCPEVAAVLVRCEPRLDPILAFAGSRDRTFVGGRFAIEVRELPEDASFVGDAGGARVYREPGPAGRLFVADGAGVARWLELPDPTVATAATVDVVGDSIAEGSSASLVGALPSWTTTIDAEIGRRTDEAIDEIATVATGDPSAVVVELGTNDVDPTTFATSARSILTSLADERLVIWVAPHAPFEVTDDIRRVLERLVGQTSNGVVADWSAAVPADALAEDGVHLLPDRVDEFARFVSSYLRPWRMAVTGAGASSCASVG